MPLCESQHSLIKLMYRTEPVVCDYFKADFQKMKEQLNIDWETFFEECEDDIDSVWNKFINKYIDAEQECIPSKTIKTGKKRFTYPLDRKSLGKRKNKYCGRDTLIQKI